jgi:MoxR-like ATPase/intein/homing endonuclease
MREEIRKIQSMMESAEYVTDAPVATSVHLALQLKKPLLIEGHAGVGKTEVAKVMARVLGTNLIRLQCYEGLDAATALYEWNYQKQLLHIKLSERSTKPVTDKEHEIFSEDFLLRRPLLQAISQQHKAPVLLIDEVDRCVAAETLVWTTAGLKPASEVRAGDEVVSFDPRGFTLTRSRVRKVVPRETSEVLQMFVGGRFIEVTPEHKFVRYTDDGHEVVQASSLRGGDRVPLHKDLPFRLEEPYFQVSDELVTLTESGKQLLRSAYQASGKTYADLAVAAGVSRTHLRNVLQPRSFRRSLRTNVLSQLSAALGTDAHLSESGNTSGLKVRQGVSFYELLGYIVADGCFTSDRLCIADKDKRNLHAYARKFEESFGVAPRIIPGPHKNFELTYHSLPLGRFLEHVLGPGMIRSPKRTVPPFVFALPADKRAGFVRGYFDGEGWVGDHQVAVGSASAYLLVGIQALLGSLGVDSHMSRVRVQPTNCGKGPYFALTVSDRRAFADAIGFCSPAKRDVLGTPPRASFARTETLPTSMVHDALRRLKSRIVLHKVSSHQTVHDILSGRVKPNVSSLRRIGTGCNSPEIADLLDRRVVLGTVTSIERNAAPRTVYDFVLEGQPYFVANQIVTHNCDEEFEAFMLEVFAEWQVTIPEIGTIKATHPPHVILTSNRTRELSDALRRRCLYLWIDYPPFDKELRIVERKVPGINARLAAEIARFMESLRRVRLAKVPGVAESLDWAQALAGLHADHLDEEIVSETLGCILKDADDIKRFRAEVGKSGLAPFLQVPG